MEGCRSADFLVRFVEITNITEQGEQRLPRNATVRMSFAISPSDEWRAALPGSRGEIVELSLIWIERQSMAPTLEYDVAFA